MNGVVLLSGGLDSTAAMFWAKARYPNFRAISFDWAQPNRDQELARAQEAAAAAGVQWDSVICTPLSGGALRATGLLRGVCDHDPDHIGIHPAFVPGRNLLFLLVAAAHAATWWAAGTIHVVLGVTQEDVAGFPDCRVNTMVAAQDMLCRGMGREIRVITPWIDRSKAQVLYAIEPDALALEVVSRSWSCYRADGPCGTCSPCVLRARAFAARGLVDRSAPIRLHGGDPARER